MLSKPTLLAAGWLLFQPRLGQLKLALQGGVEVDRVFEVLLRVLAPRLLQGCNRAAPSPHLCGGAAPKREGGFEVRMRSDLS